MKGRVWEARPSRLMARAVLGEAIGWYRGRVQKSRYKDNMC